MNNAELLAKAAKLCGRFMNGFDLEAVQKELSAVDFTVGATFVADLEKKDPEKFHKFKALWEIITADGPTRIWKGNLADHIYEYRYWLNTNYTNIVKPLLNPAPYNPNAEQLKRKRLYQQKHKATTMTRKLTEGRRGTYLRMYHEFNAAFAKANGKMMQEWLNHPEKCVGFGAGVPVEIIWAMGLTPYGINPQEAVRSADQRNSIYYLDACTEYGIPLDTCSFPQIGTGALLRGDFIEGISCAAMSNLTCDSYLAAYNLYEEIMGVPCFRLDHPYRYKTKGGRVSFASQLRELIEFIEKHTGNTLDYKQLVKSCEYYNQMQEMEIERWEHNYGANPPIPGDLLLNIHLKLFGPLTGTEEGVNIMRRQLELTRQASAKGEGCVPNQRYRAVLWNPPPGSYWNFTNWIGRCWGVAIVNDMETFGNFEFIDTSSEEALFESLAAKSMSFTMSRHTRGDPNNFFDDLFKLCDLTKPDFILHADHVGCHPVNTLRGMISEECQRHGYKVLRFEQDLGDVRVTSHQKVRDQVNSYMTNVLNATPLDPSLLVFDDSNEW